jgi:hypothetical protein
MSMTALEKNTKSYSQLDSNDSNSAKNCIRYLLAMNIEITGQKYTTGQDYLIALRSAHA